MLCLPLCLVWITAVSAFELIPHALPLPIPTPQVLTRQLFLPPALNGAKITSCVNELFGSTVSVLLG